MCDIKRITEELNKLGRNISKYLNETDKYIRELNAVSSAFTETEEETTREKEPIVTVDYLLSLLQKLSELGKGDMKIKFMDNYLHEDEITVDHLGNEILLRGNIFNFPLTERVRTFCNDIENARERFYMGKEMEEPDNE